MIKRLFIISLFLILKINNGKAEIFYKVDINTNNILFKTKDIKKTSDNLIKNDIYFYFVRYNEEHSFIEITLKTLKDDKKYFSLSNKTELISNKSLSYMNNLAPENLTGILTFYDFKNKRNYYYRVFENKKLHNEKCFIFVSGTKKNQNNYFFQIVNGVGCSTEINLNYNNIEKILSLIQISEIN